MYSPPQGGGGNYRGGGGGRGGDPWGESRGPEDKRRFLPGPPSDPPYRGPERNFPVGRDYRGREDDGPPPAKRAPPPFGRGRGDMMDQRSQSPQGRIAMPGSSFRKPTPSEDIPNDCEILAIGNPSPEYIGMVEKAISAFSLKVDVMFPKPNVKISNFIENLALRGTVFAVVIRPDNEAHKSVSVHVLRGPPKPEEHRNMPLNTAYSLIQKCYADFKKKEIGGVPENIKALLSYMIEDRSLTDQEYGLVIAFLKERRRRQMSFENRAGDEDQALYSPEELQKKILAIFTGNDGPAS